MKVAVGEEFEVMRRYWRSDDGQTQLVSSVEEGLRRARDHRADYAFITEALTAKYVVNRRPCDLVTVGEQFGTRSYGFAVAKSTPQPQMDALNAALLAMHEQGDIQVVDVYRLYDAIIISCWLYSIAYLNIRTLGLVIVVD